MLCKVCGKLSCGGPEFHPPTEQILVELFEAIKKMPSEEEMVHKGDVMLLVVPLIERAKRTGV